MGRLTTWIRHLAHLPERRSTGRPNPSYFGWALREVSGEAHHPKHPDPRQPEDNSTD